MFILVYIHIFMHIICVDIYTFIHACVYVYIYVNTYVYTYMYIYIHIYIHIHIHNICIYVYMYIQSGTNSTAGCSTCIRACSTLRTDARRGCSSAARGPRVAGHYAQVAGGSTGRKGTVHKLRAAVQTHTVYLFVFESVDVCVWSLQHCSERFMSSKSVCANCRWLYTSKKSSSRCVLVREETDKKS